MPSLDDLARHYVLDKHISTTWHNYIPIYTRLFESRRYENLCLLEIGIGVVEESQMLHTKDKGYMTGNSLRCWRDYFPNAQIYGIDIYPTTNLLHEPRIRTFVANQNNANDLETVLKQIPNHRLDIVIDDGSHDLNDQVASFTFLAHHLNERGIYIIEDIAFPHQSRFQDLSVFPVDVQTYIQTHFDWTWHDTGHQSPHHDDFMMVFQKKKFVRYMTTSLT